MFSTTSSSLRRRPDQGDLWGRRHLAVAAQQVGWAAAFPAEDADRLANATWGGSILAFFDDFLGIATFWAEKNTGELGLKKRFYTWSPSDFGFGGGIGNYTFQDGIGMITFTYNLSPSLISKALCNYTI